MPVQSSTPFVASQGAARLNRWRLLWGNPKSIDEFLNFPIAFFGDTQGDNKVSWALQRVRAALAGIGRSAQSCACRAQSRAVRVFAIERSERANVGYASGNRTGFAKELRNTEWSVHV
jgi:hypothetical protein